jgi:hypothetical protein
MDETARASRDVRDHGVTANHSDRSPILPAMPQRGNPVMGSHREVRPPFGIAKRAEQDLDVFDTISIDVFAEPPHHLCIRFNRYHSPPRPDEMHRSKRREPDVRADIDESVTRPQQRLKCFRHLDRMMDAGKSAESLHPIVESKIQLEAMGCDRPPHLPSAKLPLGERLTRQAMVGTHPPPIGQRAQRRAAYFNQAPAPAHTRSSFLRAPPGL